MEIVLMERKSIWEEKNNRLDMEKRKINKLKDRK